MCAIVGFVAEQAGTGPHWPTLWAAIRKNVRHGPHAWGVIVRRGRALTTHKTPGNALWSQGEIKRFAAGADAVVVHLRWATHGDPEENANNHPHLIDNGRAALVHNGKLTRAEELASSLEADGYAARTACDSELLALIVESSAERKRVDRVREALWSAIAYTDAPAHSVVALWPDLLVVGRAGKPLTARRVERGTYFASIGVNPKWRTIRNDSLFAVRLAKRRQSKRMSLHDWYPAK